MKIDRRGSSDRNWKFEGWNREKSKIEGGSSNRVEVQGAFVKFSKLFIIYNIITYTFYLDKCCTFQPIYLILSSKSHFLNKFNNMGLVWIDIVGRNSILRYYWTSKFQIFFFYSYKKKPLHCYWYGNYFTGSFLDFLFHFLLISDENRNIRNYNLPDLSTFNGIVTQQTSRKTIEAD